MFINNTNCARNSNIYPLRMPATYTYSKDCWDPNQANTLYDLTTAINQWLSYYYYCPSWSWRLTLGCCFVLIPLFVVADVVLEWVLTQTTTVQISFVLRTLFCLNLFSFLPLHSLLYTLEVGWTFFVCWTLVTNTFRCVVVSHLDNLVKLI